MSVVCHASCVINNVFKHLLPNCWANLDKLGISILWEVLFKTCSQNLILSKALVTIATKWIFSSNSLKIIPFRTDGPIKQFHRNVPWLAHFKNCSQNFDPSKNMPLVNVVFLHYTDMKKFLKNLLLKHWSDFEIISQEYSLADPFQKLSVKF